MRKDISIVEGNTMLRMEFDGSCEVGSEGNAGYGVVIKRDGKIIDELVGTLENKGWMTSNRAEYMALIIGLKYIKERYPGESVICRGDSKLVIRQIQGDMPVNSNGLFDLWKKASKLANSMNISFEWVHRSKNKRADELSRRKIVK